MSFDASIPRWFLLMVFLVAGVAIAPMVGAEESELSIDVADSSTYVNLARVDLEVGEMSFVDGKLVGNYAIDVPLLSSKSERGRIILSLLEEVEIYARDGGTIVGEGIAEGKDEKPRKITVAFSPWDSETEKGGIQLKIDTGERILEFESTYHLATEDLLALK